MPDCEHAPGRGSFSFHLPMPRRKHPDTAEARPQPASGERVMTLRLRANHFVRGQFARGGSLHTFSRAEAERRLRTTRLWDRA